MTSETQNNNNKSLAKLRKSKGLSKSEVASQLKLTVDVINKLENNNFKALGAYTYVRGYINNYCKLLETDSQPFLDSIPKTEFEVPLVNTHSNNTKSIKLKRHSKNMASYMVGTFVVLAISFSGWFLLKHYTKLSKSKTSVEIVADHNNLEITPQENNISDDTSQIDNSSENYHLSSIIPTDTTINDNKESQETNQQQNTNSNDANQINTTEKNNILDANSNSNDKQIPELTDSNTGNKTVGTEKLAKLSYEIIIQTDETSWVKVEEQGGKKLHNDLLKPGAITLQSDKPLHFRIGNEDNVSVKINGKEIDLSKYSRKNIADFNWPIEG